jgi:hypothetical protein
MLLLRFRGQRGKHVNARSEFHTVADRIAFTEQFVRHVKRNFKVNFPECKGKYSLAKAYYFVDIF